MIPKAYEAGLSSAQLWVSSFFIRSPERILHNFLHHFPLGNIFVCCCVFSTLIVDAVLKRVPTWLAILWHYSIIISLMVLSSHGIFVIANKWIQGCYAISETSTKSVSICRLSAGIFASLWTATLVGGTFQSFQSIDYDVWQLLEPATQPSTAAAKTSYFDQVFLTYWTITIVVT